MRIQTGGRGGGKTVALEEEIERLRRMQPLDAYYLPHDQDPFAPAPHEVAARYCPGDGRCGVTSCAHGLPVSSTSGD